MPISIRQSSTALEIAFVCGADPLVAIMKLSVIDENLETSIISISIAFLFSRTSMIFSLMASSLILFLAMRMPPVAQDLSFFFRGH